MVAQARIGRGVFAERDFDAGETITRIEGRVVHHTVLWKRRGSRFSANCLRFGPHTYLDPGRHPGRYLNHSCAPNAALRKSHGRLYLFAARRIAAGAEIVIDYSTTIGDDDIWTMRCQCGTARCRRTIRSFGALPTRVRQRYVARGMVPSYIVDTLG
jgi:SET domain